MNLILLACILLIFCGHGPHKKSVAKSRDAAPKVEQTEKAATATQDARGKTCEQITKGFDSWENRDDWVSAYPLAQQHRVLVCLDKLARGTK